MHTPPASEENLRTIRLHLKIVGAGFLSYLVALFLALRHHDLALIWVSIVSCIALCVPISLLWLRRIQAASFVFMSITLGSLAAIATIGQGCHDTVIFAFPVILVFASIVLNRTIVGICVVLMLLCISWLVFGEIHGWYIPRPMQPTGWTDFLIEAVLLLASAYAVDLLATGLRNSLLQAKNEIAQRKIADKALVQSEERFRRLFETSRDFLFFTSLDGTIIEVNKAASTLSGYTVDELKKTKIQEIYLNPEDRVQFVKKISVQGFIENLEIKGKRKNGLIVEVVVNASVIRDDHGAVIGFQGSIKDMTEHNQAQRQRQQFEQQLQRNQKLESLGILAGGIAHNFNNLLSGVYGYIELSLLATTDEKISRYLTKAMSTIEQTKGLTGQLIPFSKGAGLILTRSPLFPFLSRSAEEALQGTGVTCVCDVEPDLSECTVDINKIAQALTHIVTNAHQAMESPGSISLCARNIVLAQGNLPGLSEGRYVLISVKDSGAGILPEHLPLIYDPYFTTKSTGQGLGLAACYAIVKSHKGGIEVQSEVGKGTTVSIYLPAV